MSEKSPTRTSTGRRSRIRSLVRRSSLVAKGRVILGLDVCAGVGPPYAIHRRW